MKEIIENVIQNNQVATVLISAITAILIIVLSKYFERKSDIRKELREKKVPIYEELIRFLFNTIDLAKEGKKMDEKKAESFMREFSPKIIIWGSDDVVKSWSLLRDMSQQGKEAKEAEKAEKFLLVFEKLLLDIRKDMGHNNRDIQKRDILKIFITDM